MLRLIRTESGSDRVSTIIVSVVRGYPVATAPGSDKQRKSKLKMTNGKSVLLQKGMSDLLAALSHESRSV